MELPALTAQDLPALIPGISDIGAPVKGGQKLVFPCTYQDRRYAAKFILASPKNNAAEAAERAAEIRGRAKREVEIMKRCTSPHLVGIGPVDLTLTEVRGEHVLFFLEDYVDGDGLTAVLKQKAFLAPAEAASVGRDISRAIEALWTAEKVHRDIKPDNIRRAIDGRFVLLDVGMALDLMDDNTWTRPGYLVGTQGYHSPDQVMFLTKKRALDFRSDLFTLGIVMYECATGRHPFNARPDPLQAILHETPVAPRTVRGTVPVGLSTLIMRLLAKNPSQRFRTCAQFREHLDAAMGG